MLFKQHSCRVRVPSRLMAEGDRCDTDCKSRWEVPHPGELARWQEKTFRSETMEARLHLNNDSDELS